MKPFAIGIDIGGTNFRIGTVDADGRTRHFEKNSSRIFKEADAARQLATRIKDYIKAHTLEEQILGVGIGVPSLVSRDCRKILSTPNLKGFEGEHFVRNLEEALSLPVFLDRDVNFLLLDDLKTLSLENKESVLGFYVGTGLGNALYINGELYRGRNGAAGELGHIPLYDVTEECTCGNLGCAETRMSGRYLEKLAKQYFPREDVHFLFELFGNHPVLEKFVRDLALPIATEINILDPEAVILSGGVLYMPSFPRELLKAEILKHLRKPYPYKTLEIHFLDHTEESAVRGAGLSVHSAFYSPSAAKADFK